MRTGKWYVVRQHNGTERDMWVIRITTRTTARGVRKLRLESKTVRAVPIANESEA